MNDFQNSAQEVKERLDIVETIEKYVHLRKMGKNWAGNCPFHSEKTPSFMVNPEIQRFKCYGCGKGGDIFNFIQEIEHIEFPEALEKLAKEAGVEIKKRPVNTRFSKLEDINATASEFFYAELHKYKPALTYAQKRGLTVETLKEFKIGFAPGRGLLYNYLRTKGYSDRVIIESGLVTDTSGRIKDRFINRLMFPIWNIYGKIVAYSGRQLPGDNFGPKYLNTPETPIFHKSNTVFGLYQNKSEIKKKNLTILTEGQMDVISAYASGIRNVIAPLGTALTEQQLDSLGRYSKRLLILFDNDEAGQKALERAFHIAISKGFNVYATNTGEYKDLDESIQASVSKTKRTLSSKMDAYSYILARKLDSLDLTDITQERELVDFHKETLIHLTDPMVREHLTKKFRKITKLNPGAISQDIGPMKGTPPVKTSGASSRDRKNTAPTDININDPETYLIALLIKIGDYKKFHSLNINEFTNPFYKEIISQFASSEDPSMRTIAESSAISDQAKQILTDIALRQDKIPEPKDPISSLNEAYMRIRMTNKTKRLNSIQRQLAIAEEENDDIKIDELTQQLLQLTSQIRSLDDKISRL